MLGTFVPPLSTADAIESLPFPRVRGLANDHEAQGDSMKLIVGLFVVAIAAGTATPAQALPNYVESKGITYAANPNAPGRVSALITSTGEALWTTVLPSAPTELTLSLAAVRA